MPVGCFIDPAFSPVEVMRFIVELMLIEDVQALALAGLIVETKLPVRLRLLLPIVENSISGAALRPGDVIKARNGKESIKTIE